MGPFRRTAERIQERRAERQARRSGYSEECQPVVEQTSENLQELKTQVHGQTPEQAGGWKPEYQFKEGWHQYFFAEPGCDIHFTFRKRDGTFTEQPLVLDAKTPEWEPYPDLNVSRYTIGGKSYISFNARDSFEGASIAIQPAGLETKWINVGISADGKKPEKEVSEDEARNAKVKKAMADLKAFIEKAKVSDASDSQEGTATMATAKVLLAALEAASEQAQLQQEEIDVLKKEKADMEEELKKLFPTLQTTATSAVQEE